MSVSKLSTRLPPSDPILVFSSSMANIIPGDTHKKRRVRVKSKADSGSLARTTCCKNL